MKNSYSGLLSIPAFAPLLLLVVNIIEAMSPNKFFISKPDATNAFATIDEIRNSYSFLDYIEPTQIAFWIAVLVSVPLFLFNLYKSKINNELKPIWAILMLGASVITLPIYWFSFVRSNER